MCSARLSAGGHFNGNYGLTSVRQRRTSSVIGVKHGVMFGVALLASVCVLAAADVVASTEAVGTQIDRVHKSSSLLNAVFPEFGASKQIVLLVTEGAIIWPEGGRTSFLLSGEMDDFVEFGNGGFVLGVFDRGESLGFGQKHSCSGSDLSLLL